MTKNYKLLNRISCEQAAVRSVRFSGDGSYCITCGANKKMKLWNPFKSTLLKTYAGHANEVLDACSSCDQGQIVSGSVDKSVILWDVVSGLPTRRLRGHTGNVTTVRFNELSTMIVSGSQDNSVRLWDARSKSLEAVQVLSDAKDSISSVRVSENEILSGSYDMNVRRYDIRVGQISTDYIGEIVTCASFTKDGNCILVSCSNGIIKLFDKTSGELLCDYEGLRKSDYCFESGVNFNDTTILSGSFGGELWMWDLISHEIVGKLFDEEEPSQQPILSIAIHPTKNCFIGANGTRILMWEEDVQK